MLTKCWYDIWDILFSNHSTRSCSSRNNWFHIPRVEQMILWAQTGVGHEKRWLLIYYSLPMSHSTNSRLKMCRMRVLIHHHHSTHYALLYQFFRIAQGSGDFWVQPAKILPFTTSTGFFRIWLVANFLSLTWTGQYPIFFFQVPAK